MMYAKVSGFCYSRAKYIHSYPPSILDHLFQVLCVLYPLLLGYDVLFQDVDVVWINKDRDPLEFFQNESSNIGNFDVIFQHDGSNSIRYAPYSANSGFFYARANKRTQYLFTSLLYHSDLILTWDSQQQALVQLLAEHSSLFGLNVKILGRGTEMFPGKRKRMSRLPLPTSSPYRRLLTARCFLYIVALPSY